MEFTIARDLIAPHVDRVIAVCKNERKGYDQFKQIAIFAAEKDRLFLRTSNGYLTAIQEVKDEGGKISVIKTGQCAVDGSKLSRIIHAGGAGSLLRFKTDGTNALSREVIGEKRKVKIPQFAEKIGLDLVDVGKSKNFKIPQDVFIDSCKTVQPHIGSEDFKPHYHFLFIEFHQNNVMFIGGDGSRFVIVDNPGNWNSSVLKTDDKMGYIIHRLQSLMLPTLFNDCSNIHISFGQDAYKFTNDNGLTVTLEGIPRDFAKYVPYNVQASRLLERKVSLQLDRNVMAGICADMDAIIDPAYEKSHNVIPVLVTANKNEANISYASEFTNSMEATVSTSDFSTHNGDVDSFEDEYAMRYFLDLWRFKSSDIYEMNFLGEKDIVICRFLDNGEVSRHLMFFVSTVDVD